MFTHNSALWINRASNRWLWQICSWKLRKPSLATGNPLERPKVPCGWASISPRYMDDVVPKLNWQGSYSDSHFLSSHHSFIDSLHDHFTEHLLHTRLLVARAILVKKRSLPFMVFERMEKTWNSHNYLTINCDDSFEEEKQRAMLMFYRKDDLVYPGNESP